MKSIKAVDDAHASANSQAATQCGIFLSSEIDYNLRAPMLRSYLESLQ
jgi:hypothetical protein